MAKRVQLRRGTTAQTNTFTGAVGEVSVDTDKDVLVVHDGTTAGGLPNAARANADGTISLIKKDGTVVGVINATGLFNNTLTSTATDQALTAAQGKVLQDNKLDKTAITVSGSAPMYACRAWVNFDGTGTPTIRASGNVSSITDNGNGDYTVNFTIAMQDALYTPLLSYAGRSEDALKLVVKSATEGGSPTLKTASAIRVNYGNIDLSEVYIGIIR